MYYVTDEILDKYTFRTNFSEGWDIPIDVMEKTIASIPADLCLLSVVTRYYFKDYISMPYDEKYNYLKKIIAQLRTLVDYEYTDDDAEIYALYATDLAYINERLDICEKYENIFSLTPSNNNENTLYAYYCVKYKLLDIYMRIYPTHPEYYEKMKILLEELKSSKVEFQILRDKCLKAIELNAHTKGE